MRGVLWTAYGPPEVLRLGEVPTPEPRRGQVRIRVGAAAVTSSDCLARALAIRGVLRLAAQAMFGFGTPRRRVFGSVFSGQIDRVGPGVRGFEVGEPVFGVDPFRMGAYAEYKCVRANGTLAARPANLTDLETAAITYGGFMALHYLGAGGIATRQRVLVYGASSATGTSAVQLAKHFGAHVTGVCSARNLDLVRSLGADEVIDYTREDFTTLEGRYDLIMIAVGFRVRPPPPSRERCDAVLSPGGAHAAVDVGRPKLDREVLLQVKELAESGVLRPIIDRSYDLSEVVEAHRYVETRRKRGNVVIDIKTPVLE